MASDETSFLSGIALGRAMKGISMANPNRGDFLKVLSGHLAAVRSVPLRPAAVPGSAGEIAAVISSRLAPVGQRIRAALFLPGDPGFGGVTVAGKHTPQEERITAEAEVPGELTGSYGAALRRKPADRSLRPEDTPNGIGGTLLAAVTITIEE